MGESVCCLLSFKADENRWEEFYLLMYFQMLVFDLEHYHVFQWRIKLIDGNSYKVFKLESTQLMARIEVVSWKN